MEGGNGGGGGGRVDHACIRHPSISALRRAMMRGDAGPLPGHISAFTTGASVVHGDHTLFQPAACKKLYYTSLDLTLWMTLGEFNPSLEYHAEVRCLFVLHSVSDSSSI